ncbi:MAG: cysteine hydrolase [Desulfobacterales bacterium]|nr:cysteine hydrolase [Desulfobacterales bacterium]
MALSKIEKPALIVIDMVNDLFDPARNLPIVAPARAIIDPINCLSNRFRANGWPVVFSTDAFHEDDFIFTGAMHPHALAGTPGAQVIDDLNRTPDDYWLPKPRFSAFFDTDLETWLRQRAVTLCAVAGVATHFCVLTTVMDAICHGFKTVLLEDCTAAPSNAIHEQILNCYRRNPLYPLLQVISSQELIEQTGKAEDPQ